MCNEYSSKVDVTTVNQDFTAAGIELRFSEGTPNLEARDSIKITDTAPIVRMVAGGAGDLVQRRWSWPGPGGRPVYNFRSDNREFATGRCLIIADGFYEFTDPADKAKKRKDKWRFTRAGQPWFCIAGIWRTAPDVGEAFTMLTTVPGPDIAPYHDRQVVLLDRADWAAWLDPAVSAKTLLQPLPAGRLTVEQVG
jgi:putative SOS response-associated peptidase YedK